MGFRPYFMRLRPQRQGLRNLLSFGLVTGLRREKKKMTGMRGRGVVPATGRLVV